MEITVFAARWCLKCRDIVDIMGKSGLQSRTVLLDDSAGDLAELKDKTGSTNVPAFKVAGHVLHGYFPKQMSILFKANFEARDHIHHPLSRQITKGSS